ncbi:MAG: 2-dehydropantoate 2-reductase [Pseudomonadota bacterium]
MQIAVLGAGAVGCFYGGMLARAGHAVTLIGRPQHVEALRRDGLLLEAKAFTEYVPVQASTEPAAVEGADVVLFCVKSADTEAAGRGIAPYLRAGATVLCLQNGVDNAERLQAVLPAPVAVVPAVVYVATEMAGPGHVKHHGRGELVIGISPASAAIQQAFAAAGVPVEISGNAIGALWAKLILNCAYNALSAITRQPYGQLVQGEGVAEVMHDVVAECLTVAAAAGVTVPGDIGEAVRNIARSMPTQLSSTAQDLMRGKRSEIDFLNGFVARKGSELGVATPANRVLHTVVRLLESGAA